MLNLPVNHVTEGRAAGWGRMAARVARASSTALKRMNSTIHIKDRHVAEPSSPGDNAELLSALETKFEQIIAGLSNQSELINNRLRELIAGVANQTDVINQRFNQLVEVLANQQVQPNGAAGSAGVSYAPPMSTAATTDPADAPLVGPPLKRCTL